MIDANATTSTPSNDAGDAKPADSTAVAPAAAPADTTPPPATTEAPQTAEPKAEPEAPESYDLQVPEGVTLDPDATEAFTAIAKQLKLDNASAQKIADIGVKLAQRQQEARAKQVESWVEEVKADKDIGGDKLEENLGIAKKALDTFGTPELRDALNASGLGNHPAVIRAFLKIGKAISEDKFVTGKPASGPTDPAKILFPEMN